MSRSVVVGLVAASLLGALPAAALAAVDDVELVSRTDGAAGAPASAGVIEQTVSGDGRFVTFSAITEAGNLGPAGTHGIYVRDLVSGTTRTVSRTDGTTGAVAANGFHAKIADSGRFVCYVTGDSAISGINGSNAVVVRDLTTETNVFKVAARTTGQGLTDDQLKADSDPYARDCDVSDDGRYVAFLSESALVPADTNGKLDVYVADRDPEPDTFELVSRATGASGAIGSDYSAAPSMTPDGRYVSFRSRSDELSTENNDSLVDVYVRDRTAQTTTWASRADGPAGGAGAPVAPTNGSTLMHGSTDGALSADGRYIGFVSTNAGLVGGVTFGASTYQVYVRDLQAGKTELISRSTAPDGTVRAAGGYSDDPQLSADGRFVSFSSWAKGLDPERPDSSSESIFVHDRTNNRTALVSRQTGIFGAPADGFTNLSGISADGRFVTFGAFATNLVPGTPVNDPATPYNETAQIYRRELAPGRPLPVDLPGPPVLTLPASFAGLAPAPATASVPPPSTKPRAELGGALSFGLNEYARLKTTLQRGARGRRSGTACVGETSKNKLSPACVLYADIPGGETATGLEGANATTGPALFGAAQLATGRYRLLAAATDFAGQTTTVTRDLLAGAVPALDAYGRAVRVSGRLKAVKGGRRLAVRLACPAGEPACRTSVSLLLGKTRVAKAAAKVPVGKSRTLTLKISKKLARRLRGKGKAVKATLVLATAGRGSERLAVKVARARR